MKGYAVILFFLFGTCALALTSAFQNLTYPAANATPFNSFDQFQPKSDHHTFAFSAAETNMLQAGLVDIASIVPDAQIQLAYTSSKNFTGQILYPDLKRAFTHPAIANKLKRAQAYLKGIDTSLNLVILDAARPRSVQRQMWEWAAENDKRKYVAAPSMGSIHNYGAAVDVTIATQDSMLEMGTAYDHFGPEAEPRYNWKLYQDGVLTKEQIDNRALLREVMRKGGFRAIDSEWWHFNGVSKEFARRNFVLIE